MTLITFGRAGLLASITALVTALNPIAPAQAQYIYGDGYQQAKQGETRLTPNQREKLFRARKAWMKQSYKRRISILERERRCVDKSKAAAEFRQCKLAKKKHGENCLLIAALTSIQSAAAWDFLPFRRLHQAVMARAVATVALDFKRVSPPLPGRHAG